MDWHIDPAGEFVDLAISEETGLTPPFVITIRTDFLGDIYNQLRAAQLSADSMGNL